MGRNFGMFNSCVIWMYIGHRHTFWLIVSWSSTFNPVVCMDFCPSIPQIEEGGSSNLLGTRLIECGKIVTKLSRYSYLVRCYGRHQFTVLPWMQTAITVIRVTAPASTRPLKAAALSLRMWAKFAWLCMLIKLMQTNFQRWWCRESAARLLLGARGITSYEAKRLRPGDCVI